MLHTDSWLSNDVGEQAIDGQEDGNGIYNEQSNEIDYTNSILSLSIPCLTLHSQVKSLS